MDKNALQRARYCPIFIYGFLWLLPKLFTNYCVCNTILEPLFELLFSYILVHKNNLQLKPVAWQQFLVTSSSYFEVMKFIKRPTPASFSFTFVFSNKHYNFYNK